jgi:type I restriction enzyme S subunit
VTRELVDTGEAWLGAIPSDWRVAPAKSAFAERREPCSPNDVQLTPSQAHGVLPQNKYMEITGSRVVLNLGSQDNMKHVEPDDFIIHLRSFQGGLEHSTLGGKVSTAYTVLKPQAGTRAEFFRWLLKSDGYIQKLRTTTNQLRDGQSIKYGDFAKIRLPMPPVAEQRAIATYLDRETAQIDTMIEEQQRLIELLRERRAAVISHATGWSGNVPAHWTHQRLSWIFEATASGTTPAPEDILDPSDETIPWVTTGELRESRIRVTTKAVSPRSLQAYSALKIHPAGSLLIAMYGATIGRMAILDVDATSNQACCSLSIPSRASSEFVLYSLVAARSWLLLDAAGGGQPNVNQDKVRTFRIPLPSIDEQKEIVAHLDEQTAKIDALIAETERFIELSRERRAALITAAVTGQIDVRGEVA